MKTITHSIQVFYSLGNTRAHFLAFTWILWAWIHVSTESEEKKVEKNVININTCTLGTCFS